MIKLKKKSFDKSKISIKKKLTDVVTFGVNQQKNDKKELLGSTDQFVSDTHRSQQDNRKFFLIFYSPLLPPFPPLLNLKMCACVCLPERFR